MIPHIIHYCWFGNKKIPKDFRKYIEGWKKLCPDYEIKEWNEKNFSFQKSLYCRQAYKAQKWAFVTDYARFRILYEYGGIYLDTDVELIKPLNSLLEECEKTGIQGFMGIERPETGDVAPGLICAAEPKNPLIKELLMGYKGRRFIDESGQQDLTTVVEYTNTILARQISTMYKQTPGLVDNHIDKSNDRHIDNSGDKHNAGIKLPDKENGIIDIKDSKFRIYPADYFNPMDMNTGEIKITENTYSIHHYASSWVDGYSRLRGKIYKGIRRNFGEKAATISRRLLGR